MRNQCHRLFILLSFLWVWGTAAAWAQTPLLFPWMLQRTHNSATAPQRGIFPRPLTTTTTTTTRWWSGQPPLARHRNHMVLYSSVVVGHHPALRCISWLRGGGGAAAAAAAAMEALASDDDLASNAFDWCSQLGAPAALVAGAVLATLSETRPELIPRKNDSKWIRIAKKTCRALLLSSFALEIFCIFVTSVTGTMLLSHGDSPAGMHAGIHYHSPMGFLNFNHEFEYLTARVTFLQGLLNWLWAVALDLFIPKRGEGTAARKMNLFISSSLITMSLLILKFFNDHMTFYHNYGEMLWRYVRVTWLRYFWIWPIRPMAVLTVPWLVASVILGWQAFAVPPDQDDEEAEAGEKSTSSSD